MCFLRNKFRIEYTYIFCIFLSAWETSKTSALGRSCLKTGLLILNCSLYHLPLIDPIIFFNLNFHNLCSKPRADFNPDENTTADNTTERLLSFLGRLSWTDQMGVLASPWWDPKFSFTFWHFVDWNGSTFSKVAAHAAWWCVNRLSSCNIMLQLVTSLSMAVVSISSVYFAVPAINQQSEGTWEAF